MAPVTASGGVAAGMDVVDEGVAVEGRKREALVSCGVELEIGQGRLIVHPFRSLLRLVNRIATTHGDQKNQKAQALGVRTSKLL